tara:strand:- start:279 stop:674 length:396 start_codon:yes stop_codon:yes gene_type:complete
MTGEIIDSRSEEELEAREALGKKLAEARKRIGITQQQLAKRSRVSRVNISRYEIGTTPIRFMHASRIAEALGISVDELLASTLRGKPQTRAEKFRSAIEQLERIKLNLDAVQLQLKELAADGVEDKNRPAP